MTRLSRPRAAPLLALTFATAAAGAAHAADDAYFPKFARQEQRAEMLASSTCTMPDYPKASLRNEETGTVQLRFTIAPNGSLLKADVEKSTGHPLLDQAAANGMGTCKFVPGSISGKPVQAVARMQYVWTLD